MTRRTVLEYTQYWSRRVFPLAAVTWIALVVLERKIGLNVPGVLEGALVGIGIAAFPAGFTELRRYGDQRAWFAWIALIAIVILAAVLRFYF